MKKIYLACPYSHPDPRIREGRFYAANQAAADIMAQGHIVFSTISHSHPIHAQCDNVPGDFEYWQKFNRSWIDWCDEVWILCLHGYKASKGIEGETEYAESLGKPVREYWP